MREPSTILLAPVITEKSSRLKEQKKYVFEVSMDANKIEIARAVEALYKGVEVAKVNVTRVHPKWKRIRFHSGLTKWQKKAIVTLKKGEIDFFKA
ncbi:MAG: 50S ribosomal protein L23 [Brevinematales bacterium]